MESMHYIGLDVHKKTIGYCVKDASGQVLQEGKIGATRDELASLPLTIAEILPSDGQRSWLRFRDS